MFEILISTINDNYFKKHSNLLYDHIIINQLIDIKESSVKKNNVISQHSKGLSKSRNTAILSSNSKICLISDDDVEYVEGVDSIVLAAFKLFPTADIITFQIKTPENLHFRKYRNKPFWHNHKTIMEVSSVEISFYRERVISNGLVFDENFGLGSKFPTGEEAIFLHDALNKGLKVLYFPFPIVTHSLESSGSAFKNNPVLIQAKGAMLYRIFQKKAYIISLVFSFKKYRLSNFSFLKFYSLMLQGIKEYRNEQ